MLFESVYRPIKEIEPDSAEVKLRKTDQENEIILKMCGQHLHNKATRGDIDYKFNTTKTDKFISYIIYYAIVK